jgi:hypothetical protein
MCAAVGINDRQSTFPDDAPEHAPQQRHARADREAIRFNRTHDPGGAA